ncbi:MAG: DUF2914 domain-containing protein [Deltaproteobacteria bacterium]|nr:DUF2914 domain-containing protein [Deltaproteobacteria bacterium]
MNDVSPRQRRWLRLGPLSRLLVALLAAPGCGGEADGDPEPPAMPAANWTVPAPPDAAPRAVPVEALARPVMSEAERRAIEEARARSAQPVPAPAVPPPVVATPEPPPAQEATPPPIADAPADEPEEPSALSPEDLAALRDDPAARALPEPAPTAPAPTPVVPDPPAAAPAAPPADPAPADGAEVRPGVTIAPAADDTLSLTDLAIATAVVDREPEGAAASFDTLPPLFLCYSVFDQREESATVTHVWSWNDREVARVELEVGRSPKWRTWSRQRLQPDQSGRWSCEVLAPDGRRLGLARVTVGR